ncbi:MAG: hypothetical protein U0105_10610 [Candidatus Obscuribacterales bacterium]
MADHRTESDSGTESTAGLHSGAPQLVSAQDMDEYAQIVNAISDNFSTFDGNGDLMLTDDELDTAIQNSSLRDDQREIASILFNNFDEATAMGKREPSLPLNLVAGHYFSGLFGDQQDPHAITEADVNGMKTAADPERFAWAMKRLNTDELLWGSTSFTAGSITGAIGLILTGGAVMSIPETGGLGAAAVPIGLGVTAAGGGLIKTGIDIVFNSGYSDLYSEFATRRRILSDWTREVRSNDV